MIALISTTDATVSTETGYDNDSEYSRDRNKVIIVSLITISSNKVRSTNLSSCGRGKPSSAQETWGVGAPDAMHFKLTEGPGWSVWLMKRYSSTGAESEEEKNDLITPFWIRQS